MKKFLSLTFMALTAHIAFAQSAPTDESLNRIFSSHIVNIGVRDASAPLSYRLPDGSYVGLAIDLCNLVAQRLAQTDPSLRINYVLVSSSSRIPDLQSGKIDMECGSTTDNDSRSQQVNFGIPYYVSGITGVVRANTGYKKLGDLPDGSRIVYTKGTTTAAAVGTLDKSFYFRDKNHKFTQYQGSDHQQSFNMVAQGKADIFLNDNILIYGLIANSDHPEQFKVLDQVFSVEPYAIMIRKDSPALTGIVNQVIAGSMKSGQFEKLYNKWFMQPIPPKNVTLNVPMSATLYDYVRFPTSQIGAYTK